MKELQRESHQPEKRAAQQEKTWEQTRADLQAMKAERERCHQMMYRSHPCRP